MAEAPEKSKRPANSAFKQQRLAAWQPILTAGTVLPTFFVIGILFIPVGIGLLFFSDNVKEITLEYTYCLSKTTKKPCFKEINADNSHKSCECEPINFEIKEAFQGKVYIYYALTNFYQNHRRYVKSRDDKQLLGKTDVEPDTACEPFRKSNGLPIFPCGAIANSMFSDEISLLKDGIQVPLLRNGIAWDSDKQYKFKNPDWWSQVKTKCNNSSTTCMGKIAYPTAWGPNLRAQLLEHGVENEDLIVWMRTAALPNFRKLYRIVNHDHDSGQGIGIRNGLPAGNYSLQIAYSFPVTSFQGTKSVVISTTSLLGGKNPFLGVSYIVVGAVCLVLGIVFLFIHINYGKSTWEMTNVDPRTPYN